MIPEGDEAHRNRPPHEGERDTLAERRARRAWLGDAALLRRAEAAEATVRTLEAHLADLRHRQVEAELERENAAAQLAERDRELRRVKQREYAEQQLRVEAEEATGRIRRGHRAELERLQQRAEEARATAQHAEEQRAALAARLAEVGNSCTRLQLSIDALQNATTELRATFERDQEAAQARIEELERALARAAQPARPERSEAEEARRREEMAGALAAAVERLRTRMVAVEDSPEDGAPVEETAEAPIEATAQQTVGKTAQQAAGAPTAELSDRAIAAEEQMDPRADTAPQAAAPAPPQATVPASPQATAPAPPASAHAPEIPTVYVVPRLFSSSRRRDRANVGRRFAPTVRRVAGRLAAWAERAQSPQ